MATPLSNGSVYGTEGWNAIGFFLIQLKKHWNFSAINVAADARRTMWLRILSGCIDCLAMMCFVVVSAAVTWLCWI
jgi:hypothetical protein